MTTIDTLDRKVEADLEAQFLRVVAGLCPAARVRKASWVGRRGATDRVIFLPRARTVWVELKNGSRGRISGNQTEEIRALSELEFHVWVIRSLDDLCRFASWFRGYV